MTLKDSPVIKNWLSNLAESTQITQIHYFKVFIKWVNLEAPAKFRSFTPEDLINYQKENKDYELLDMVVKPFIRQTSGTYNTKNSRYNNIRSFFAHNRAELPKDKQFKIRPDREPIQGTLNANEIKTALLSCNPVYQAVFFSMFQGAMDQEMFQYWNLNGWDELHEQLDDNIVKINLPGRKINKNIRPYYTLINGDALKSVKSWLLVRKEKVKHGKILGDSKIIFVDKLGKAIEKRTMREYWTSHLRKKGIVPPLVKGADKRYTGKGLHEMRDVFRSLWSKSPASHTVCEYLMGHSIDALEYDKSFRDVGFYKSEYTKASPYLNLFSSGAAFGEVPKSEVESLRVEIGELHAIIERKDQAGERTVKGMDEVLKTIAELQAEVNKMKAEKESLGE